MKKIAQSGHTVECPHLNRHRDQCDQTGRVLEDLSPNLLTKVGQKDWWRFGLYWKISLYVKTAVQSIWATFGNSWATFLLQNLIALLVPKSRTESFFWEVKCNAKQGIVIAITVTGKRLCKQHNSGKWWKTHQKYIFKFWGGDLSGKWRGAISLIDFFVTTNREHFVWQTLAECCETKQTNFSGQQTETTFDYADLGYFNELTTEQFVEPK